MPRIFNSIRQRLLKENRFTRYLVYAVGEIVLVVVGILIALSINTWNKSRQDLRARAELLDELRDDLVLDQATIAEHIQWEELFLAEVDSARVLVKGRIDTDALQALLRRLTTRHTFVPNKTTIVKMTASGELGLLRNSGIENSIVRYYQFNDYLTSVTNNNNLYIVDLQFGPFVSNNALGFGCDADGAVEDDLDLDPEKRYLLKVQLDRRALIARTSIDRFSKLKEAATDLLQRIEQVPGE
ncbi:MAG: hypothetical protein H6595_03630 [Flavobacteriales bacterium]|nr:hypothetical protein [Flavobacteriales bacterium]MCB9166550.1 hypothetical protein [Flavobacteriales bacterium]